MLSMLEIVRPESRNRFSRMWHNITAPAVSAYMRPAGDRHYLRIKCEERRGRIDWKMIRAYSLDCSDRILMPVGLQPPEDSRMRRFTPYVFRRRLLENMAADILVCSEKRPELRRVAVYGQDNEVTALLPRLTGLAGEVRVITRRPHAVADTVEQLREKTGASIGITDQFDASGFDVLIASAGGAQVFTLWEKIIVLSPDRPGSQAALWIRDARPSLPAVLESEYSTEYDLTEFIGAFYEAGEMRQLGRMSPAAGITESGEITPEDAAQLISR